MVAIVTVALAFFVQVGLVGSLHPGAAADEMELPPELASLGVGDSVFYKNFPAKIVWDGRPEHDFVKVKWEAGPKPGQTRMVSLAKLTLTQQADRLGGQSQ